MKLNWDYFFNESQKAKTLDHFIKHSSALIAAHYPVTKAYHSAIPSAFLSQPRVDGKGPVLIRDGAETISKYISQSKIDKRLVFPISSKRLFTNKNKPLFWDVRGQTPTTMRENILLLINIFEPNDLKSLAGFIRKIKRYYAKKSRRPAAFLCCQDFASLTPRQTRSIYRLIKKEIGTFEVLAGNDLFRRRNFDSFNFAEFNSQKKVADSYVRHFLLARKANELFTKKITGEYFPLSFHHGVVISK